LERAGGLLAAVPVGGDAEVQGDQGGREPDRDQQASETDPGASAASQGDHQGADYRNQQTDFCDSPRGHVVEGRREHRGGSSPSAAVGASSTPTRRERRHRLEPVKTASLSLSRFGGKGDKTSWRRARPCRTRFTGEADIALLDIELSKMDGLTAAELIRSVRPQVRVILNTSSADGAKTGKGSGARPNGAIKGDFDATIVGSPNTGSELVFYCPECAKREFGVS
jgi:CheY-like chemotaxis protein